MDVKPVTLEGEHIRLLPMSMEHYEQLCSAGINEDLWRFVPTRVRDREEMKDYVRSALKSQEAGTALPFVTVDRLHDTLVGSTRYGNIDRVNRRVEIGWTWIVPDWQNTFVNTECKYLLLKHAFEELGCVRVEFKADSLNDRSRKALVRIGAKEEGIFRNHMIMPDGRLRHSVYYSIIESEWPEVKKTLEGKMRRHEQTG